MFKKIFITLSIVCITALFAAGNAFALTAAGTQIQNTASATYKDVNNGVMLPVTSNQVTVTVLQVGGVTLSVSPTLANGNPGDSETYQFTLTNTGNGSDTYNLTSGTHTGTFTATGTTTYYSNAGCTTQITAPVGPIAQNGTTTFWMKATIPLTATNGQDSYDPAIATSVWDNTQTATATPDTHCQQGNMVLTKTASNYAPVSGNTITFTILAQNTGLGTAKTITITDDLTAMNTIATFVSGSLTIDGHAESNPASYTPMVISSTSYSDLSDLAAGGSHTITFQMTVNGGVIDQTTKTNTATVTSGPGGPYTGTPSTTPNIVVQAPLLAVVKSANPTSAKPGATVTYTIVATNNGHSAANAIVLTDAIGGLPVTFVSNGSSPSASTTDTGTPTASYSSGTVTGQISSLASTKTLTLTFQVTIN